MSITNEFDKTRPFMPDSEAKAARRLFIKIMLFAPVLLVVVAVNMGLDPRGLLGKPPDKFKRDEYHIARALIDGQNVKIVHRIDDRLLQKYLIEQLPWRPDVVVFGSSHSFWLGENVFLNKKVINNSVSDGELTDYLGIFEGYAKRNLYPRRVVLLLEYTLMDSPIERTFSIRDDVHAMLNRLGVSPREAGEPLIPMNWLHVFSFSYFQDAVSRLGEPSTGDGGYLFQGERRSLSENERTGHFMKRMFRPLRYGPGEFEGRKKILEKFIRYLKGHGVRVTLLMLPYEPQQYEVFLDWEKKGYWGVTGMERSYRKMARRLGVEITGSYDPAACGLGQEDFYDGVHIKNEVIDRVLKQKGSVCYMPD